MVYMSGLPTEVLRLLYFSPINHEFIKILNVENLAPTASDGLFVATILPDHHLILRATLARKSYAWGEKCKIGLRIEHVTTQNICNCYTNWATQTTIHFLIWTNRDKIFKNPWKWIIKLCQRHRYPVSRKSLNQKLNQPEIKQKCLIIFIIQLNRSRLENNTLCNSLGTAWVRFQNRRWETQ